MKQISSESQLTIIIPTLNESENINSMLKLLLTLYPEISILVVDDGSMDGTKEIVLKYALENKKVQLLDRSEKEIKGLTVSLVEAINYTTTEFFFVIDCDFQHPPESIQEGLELLIEGFILVVGIREKILGWTFKRKFISKGAQTLGKISLMLRKKSYPKDIMSGFFGAKTLFIQNLLKKNPKTVSPKGYKLLFDILKVFPAQNPIGEFSYTFKDRKSGKSKIGMKQIMIYFRSLF